LALDKSILDTATAEVRDFRRKLGYEDKSRLTQYLESVRELEKRLDDHEAILDRGRPQFDEKGIRLDPQGKNGMQEHIEMMMDLIALSFQTDMTRVVTHSLGGEGGPNYDEYKEWARKTGAPTRGAHDFHHKGTGNRGADNADVQVLGIRDAMFCAQLARLMDKLQSIEAVDAVRRAWFGHGHRGMPALPHRPGDRRHLCRIDHETHQTGLLRISGSSSDLRKPGRSSLPGFGMGKGGGCNRREIKSGCTVWR